MKAKPISEFMTPEPHSLGVEQTLSRAHEIMREHGIRHLPVLDGGRIVGMLSQRDLHLVETLSDLDPEKVTVEEAMAPEPYCVTPSAPLGEVASHMAERKLGAAIVADGNKVVGVFTTVDALRALAAAVEKI
jgi:acetoin utilization protein AcuB